MSLLLSLPIEILNIIIRIILMKKNRLSFRSLKKNMFVVLGIPFTILILIYVSNSGIITDVNIDNKYVYEK